MSSSELLKGKTALITGSNRGIGKALVEAFASNGANIIACARKETDEFKTFLKDIATEFEVETFALYFDLAFEDQIKKGLKPILSNRTKIDILVNNAGVHYGGFLQMTSLQKIKEVFEINFFSQLFVIQQISKLMIRQKSGSIINIASMSGIDSFAGYSAYGSSKAAFIHSTLVLAKELSPFNIRINAIAPGFIDTDMSKGIDSKALETTMSEMGITQLASPLIVSDAALFLASDLSLNISGQVYKVTDDKYTKIND